MLILTSTRISSKNLPVQRGTQLLSWNWQYTAFLSFLVKYILKKSNYLLHTNRNTIFSQSSEKTMSLLLSFIILWRRHRRFILCLVIVLVVIIRTWFFSLFLLFFSFQTFPVVINCHKYKRTSMQAKYFFFFTQSQQISTRVKKSIIYNQMTSHKVGKSEEKKNEEYWTSLVNLILY